MRKKLLIAFVFVFLLYPLSHGRSEEKKYFVVDGYEWASMRELERLGFVKGWLRASTASFGAIMGLQLSLLNPTRTKNPIQLVDCHFKGCWEMAFKAIEAEGLNLEDFTVGQIMDTISKIYSDPRVKKWEINRIMPIVYGRLKKGWTEKDIDEVIAFYIKLDDHSERSKNFSSKSETEQNRINDEHYSLWSSEPEVLKALKKYE